MPVGRRHLAGSLSTTPDGSLTLHLYLTASGRLAPKRLALAIERIAANDAAIELTLRRASTESVDFSFRPNPATRPPESLRTAFPLLLPLAVSEPLYRFQRSGVAWLLRHDRAILADDMGLGKTAQVLAALRRLMRLGKAVSAVVAAPKTLVSTWMTETSKWAPELLVSTPVGNAKSFEEVERFWQRELRRSHLIVTNYEQVRDPPAALLEMPPDVLVADEAHRLRNADSQTHQGFRDIRSPRLWALTGTPVERHPGDLAVLLSLLFPHRYAADDDDLEISALRARARPYLLRRTKNQVLQDLPSARYQTETLDLLPSQRAAYDRAIREGASSQDSGLLALFTQLRSICDLSPDGRESVKLDRIADLCREIAAKVEKAVVFSYLLDPLQELARRFRTSSGVGATVLTGSLSERERLHAVDRFKADPDCHVLLASMRVASEGLTLTEANHVLFVNRWWNPSANAQAADRVLRIGQHRPVTVYYFVARNTVEDRLESLLERKQMDFDQLVNALREPDSGIGADDLLAEK